MKMKLCLIVKANYDFSGLTFGRSTKHDVHIPKFKIESTHELNDPLKNLGLTDMFDESLADFSGKETKFERGVLLNRCSAKPSLKSHLSGRGPERFLC